MRLIDANAMMKRLEEWNTNDSMDKALYNFTLCRINEQQTIEERKTGRWIWDDEGYHCSECLFHAYGDTLSCLDGTFKYCPHCGARMVNGDD